MSEKLNVLFIITDAMRSDHMSCAGNQTIKTPNAEQEFTHLRVGGGEAPGTGKIWCP